MYISQVVNGIVLPVILVFMLLLINNKKLMGEYANKRAYNIISWATVAILTVLTVAYVVQLVGHLTSPVPGLQWRGHPAPSTHARQMSKQRPGS